MSSPDPQMQLLDDLYMSLIDARRLTRVLEALNLVETNFETANGIKEALDYMGNVNAHLDTGYKALSEKIVVGDDLS